jgi:hypothetical protein
VDRNYPDPPGPARTPLEALRREVIFSINETDKHVDELQRQVVALEEIAAVRWPRSIVVRARLRRDLRRSVEHIQGATFADRRVNTIGSGWLDREEQLPEGDDEHGGRHRR